MEHQLNFLRWVAIPNLLSIPLSGVLLTTSTESSLHFNLKYVTEGFVAREVI